MQYKSEWEPTRPGPVKRRGTLNTDYESYSELRRREVSARVGREVSVQECEEAGRQLSRGGGWCDIPAELLSKNLPALVPT